MELKPCRVLSVVEVRRKFESNQGGIETLAKVFYFRIDAQFESNQGGIETTVFNDGVVKY